MFLSEESRNRKTANLGDSAAAMDFMGIFAVAFFNVILNLVEACRYEPCFPKHHISK